MTGKIIAGARTGAESLSFAGTADSIKRGDARRQFGIDNTTLAWTHPGFQPDLTLLFDVPAEVGAVRLARHGGLDKFESEEAEFHRRVRAAYLARAAADSRRFRIIDSTQPIDAVKAELRRVIEAL